MEINPAPLYNRPVAAAAMSESSPHRLTRGARALGRIFDRIVGAATIIPVLAVVTAACLTTERNEEGEARAEARPKLAILYTANNYGYLDPCG